MDQWRRRISENLILDAQILELTRAAVQFTTQLSESGNQITAA